MRRISNTSRVSLESAIQSWETLKGVRSDYAAAKPSQYRRRRNGLGGGADAHFLSETAFLQVREYVRDMDRNDAVIGQMIDRAVQNTIQQGFKLDPRTGDKALDEELKARWKAWSEDPDQCDTAGEMTFWEKERTTLRSTIIDGDVFHLPLEDGTLQTQEADRCRTPFGTKRRVVHGVLLDEMRRRQEYWFTREPMDPLSRLQLVSDIEAYSARDEGGHRQVFHIYSPKRVTQTRGVTWLAPVFDVCGMVEDLQFAALVKQQMAASLSWFLERDPTVPYEADVQTGERRTELLEDGSSATIDGVSPGMFIRGKPGEKLVTNTPNVPGDAFFPHMKLLLNLIGINVGMPLMLVLLDGSDQNLSQWRGTMEQAKMGFRDNQKLLTLKFHSPVYQWQLRRWLATPARAGGLGEAARRLGSKLMEHVWHPPTWPYIQPLDDAKADALRIKEGLASARQVAAENGRDYDELAREVVEDKATLIILAVEASKKLEAAGVVVPWQSLMPPGEKGDGAGAGGGAAGGVAGGGAGGGSGGVAGAASAVPLNGAQVEGTLSVLSKMREGALNLEAAVEMLQKIGFDESSAGLVARGVNSLDAGAGDVAFKREVLKSLLSVPAAREAVYNGMDIEDLISATGLPPEAGYQAPYIPVVGASGPLVSGETIKDSQNDVVGGDVLEPDDDTAPAAMGLPAPGQQTGDQGGDGEQDDDQEQGDE